MDEPRWGLPHVRVTERPADDSPRRLSPVFCVAKSQTAADPLAPPKSGPLSALKSSLSPRDRQDALGLLDALQSAWENLSRILTNADFIKVVSRRSLSQQEIDAIEQHRDAVLDILAALRPYSSQTSPRWVERWRKSVDLRIAALAHEAAVPRSVGTDPLLGNPLAEGCPEYVSTGAVESNDPGAAGRAAPNAAPAGAGHDPRLTPMVPDFPTAYPAAYWRLRNDFDRPPDQQEVATDLRISKPTFKRYRGKTKIVWPPRPLPSQPPS